jgi:hypothetical protein
MLLSQGLISELYESVYIAESYHELCKYRMLYDRNNVYRMMNPTELIEMAGPRYSTFDTRNICAFFTQSYHNKHCPTKPLHDILHTSTRFILPNRLDPKIWSDNSCPLEMKIAWIEIYQTILYRYFCMNENRLATEIFESRRKSLTFCIDSHRYCIDYAGQIWYNRRLIE